MALESSYLNRPNAGAKNGGHQQDGHDGDLGFCDIHFPKTQGPRHVRLPMGAVEERHGAKTLKNNQLFSGNYSLIESLLGKTSRLDSCPIEQPCKQKQLQIQWIMSRIHGRKVLPMDWPIQFCALVFHQLHPDFDRRRGRWRIGRSSIWGALFWHLVKTCRQNSS